MGKNENDIEEANEEWRKSNLSPIPHFLPGDS